MKQVATIVIFPEPDMEGFSNGVEERLPVREPFQIGFRENYYGSHLLHIDKATPDSLLPLLLFLRFGKASNSRFL